MRKQTCLILIGAAIIVIGLALFLFPPEFSYRTTFNISAQTAFEIANPCYWNENVEGYFTVTGGNNTVEFCAVNHEAPTPYGVVIYNAEMVQNRHDFAFSSEQQLTYSLSFYNHQNSTITICLNSERIVTRGYDLAIIHFGVLFSILIFPIFKIQQKRAEFIKNQTTKTDTS
jgi:hypothetical protein